MPNFHTVFVRFGPTFAVLGATGVAFIQPVRPLIFVGQSMAPTYASGAIAITTPVESPLKHGDVVVINRPDGAIVKRVAYLSGEVYAKARVPNPNGKGGIMREQFVPEGFIYVLGDNRTISLDSRTFGPVPMEWVSRKILNPRPYEAPPARL